MSKAGNVNRPRATELPISNSELIDSSRTAKSILVLSRELSGNVGGVVSYVRAEKHALAPEFDFVHMDTGSRVGEGFFSKLVRFANDPIALRKTIRSRPFDFVQINPSMKVKPLIRDGLFCRFIRRCFGGHLVVVFHGWNPSVADFIERRMIARRLFLMSFGGAQLLVVLSDKFASKLISIGVPKARVKVLPSMFDDRDLRSFKRQPTSKEKIVLFMSRLDKKKGALELIEAFSSRAGSQWDSWKLVIAGEGIEKQNADHLVKSLGVSDRVSVVGQLIGSAKTEMFARASIFALPTSDDEGLPISVLEAMAAGCALITTSVGGLAETLRDGVNGIVMESVSLDSIAEGLDTLIRNEEFRNECQRNCHEMAWREYASSVVVGNFRKLLLEIKS